MKPSVAICALLVALGTIVCISAYAPRWLDDSNTFLQGFIKQDLLSILGVILAITLASASQVHLKFNDLEERMGKPFLQASRREVVQASYALLIVFVIAVALVLVKPVLLAHHIGIALVNGFGVWLLLFNIAVLFDITAGIFSIPPINLPNASPQVPEPQQPLVRK